MKTGITTVQKKWGREEIIVNNESYCAKFLYIDQGAQGSLHYHRVKKETFYGLEGQVGLHIDGKDYMLNAFARPKTIEPGVPHCIVGLGKGINKILEVSTHHSDEDVVRLNESTGVVNKESIQ